MRTLVVPINTKNGLSFVLYSIKIDNDVDTNADNNAVDGTTATDASPLVGEVSPAAILFHNGQTQHKILAVVRCALHTIAFFIFRRSNVQSDRR